MTHEVHQEIEALRKQRTKALKARYLELFGEQSRSSNHAHLFRRIAWRLQSLSEGDLSQRAQERAAETGPVHRKQGPLIQGQRSLRCYPSNNFQQELVAPAAAPTFHGDAVLARVLL